jgi:hypothetical protein
MQIVETFSATEEFGKLKQMKVPEEQIIERPNTQDRAILPPFLYIGGIVFRTNISA